VVPPYADLDEKCLCKQACNTLSHSNQRMAEL
jgi:hypothetical protein